MLNASTKKANGMCTKVAVHAMMILLTTLTSVSCSSRDEDTPDIDKGVRCLELKVGVRDFADSENYGQNAQESDVRNLSLFLFHPDGRELVLGDRHQVIKDGKITVTLPADAAEQELSAYLVANHEFASDAPVTEGTLLQEKTDRRPEDLTDRGFPMSTERIAVKANEPVFSATAVLQRVSSSLCVQVDEAAAADGIHNNSYKVEVEGLQVSEGALFEDAASLKPAQGKTDYSLKLTAVNVPENITYFYQSGEIKIYITPCDPGLGKEQVVTIGASKAAVRNKKFIIQIVPVKIATRVVDFRIEVAEWKTEVIVVEIPFSPDKPVDDGILFAEGVSFESGWYDLNKASTYGASGYSPDSKLCWAAACSNMVQWWQDRYVESGGVLPEDTPNGYVPGRENEEFRQLAVFEAFAKNAGNISNSPFSYKSGLPWYFTTYFPELFPNDDPFFDNSDKAIAKEFYPQKVKGFSDIVINGFRKGGVFCMITTNKGGGGTHARTLWGCKYNPATGIIEQLFYTDSDDKRLLIWKDAPLVASSDGKPTLGGIMEVIESIAVLYTYPR